MGINNFGFGGVNCHVLVKPNEKVKVNNGEPVDDLPRLVITAGRTQEAVNSILQDVSNTIVYVVNIRILVPTMADGNRNDDE